MNTDIFISYRRDDEPGFVRQLYALLKITFLHHDIFMDVELDVADIFPPH